MNNRSGELLAVVMPVYNEEGIVAEVLKNWTDYLDKLDINYRLHIYNDGSRDRTSTVLAQCRERMPRLVVHEKHNTGHGPTILSAYRQHADADWIFQVDSDNEIEPRLFRRLWRLRSRYDFIIGQRVRRQHPLPRAFISSISRLVVWIFYGRGVYDVNSPYRLMRCQRYRKFFNMIPSDTVAPNIMLAGVTVFKRIPCREIPVNCRPRKTGRVSIRKLKLFKVSLLSFRQTILFSFRLRQSVRKRAA